MRSSRNAHYIVKFYIFKTEKKRSIALNGSYDPWLSRVCESETTNRRYLEDIRQFEQWAKVTHNTETQNIPAKWREAKYSGELNKERYLDELKDLVDQYFADLKKSGRYTGMSINHRMAVVMSYLHFYDIPIKPVRIRYPYIEYHNRDITKDEIKTILDHSDVRNRGIFLMLYESGIRPITLVNLRWRHIKDDFMSRKIPMKIELTPDIMKCRVTTRFVFIGDQGRDALAKYLSLRLPLKDDDLIFVTEKPAGGKMRPNAVSQIFNKIVSKLNLAEKKGNKPKALRLYCLRKAFRKFMATEVDSAYVEFWMGHTNTSTHYLSEDVEHHRTIYAKGYKALRITQPDALSEDVLEALKKKDDEIKALEESIAKLQPLIDWVNSYPTIEEMKEALGIGEEYTRKDKLHSFGTVEEALAGFEKAEAKREARARENGLPMTREEYETRKKRYDKTSKQKR